MFLLEGECCFLHVASLCASGLWRPALRSLFAPCVFAIAEADQTKALAPCFFGVLRNCKVQNELRAHRGTRSPLSASEDELPPGWTQALSSSGVMLMQSDEDEALASVGVGAPANP